MRISMLMSRLWLGLQPHYQSTAACRPLHVWAPFVHLQVYRYVYAYKHVTAMHGHSPTVLLQALLRLLWSWGLLTQHGPSADADLPSQPEAS